MIKLAFSKTDITPRTPCHLSGFLKERIATSVHDNLYARSLFFFDEVNNKHYLLIQLDLIAIDFHLRNKIAYKLNSLIESDNIVLCATHTHAGPMGTVTSYGADNVFGTIDENYLKMIANNIADDILKIKDDLLPCYISYAHADVKNVGSERHDPKLEGDTSLFYMEFRRSDNARAFIYNFACHPTVTGSNNSLITKDLPYLTEENYQDELCIFINSDAGNISTRFTRESSDFKQIERYTKEIVEAVDCAKLNKSKQKLLKEISFNVLKKTYKLKNFRTQKEIEEDLFEYENKVTKAKEENLDKSAIRLIESLKEGALVELELLKYFKEQRTIDVDLTFIKFNDLKIVGIPGELFSSLGIKLKNMGIEVFGYTNGYLLYLADKNAYDQNYYEALSSPLLKGTAEEIIQDTLDYFVE